MKKQSRIILLTCGAILLGFTLLQAIWLYRFYDTSRDRFRKDTNLAFEDAVKREFMLRCDTLEKIMYGFLVDTTHIRISSKWSDKFNKYVYTIQSVTDSSDRFNLSLKDVNSSITRPLDSAYLQTARALAHSYRKENLEDHTIYYYTQHLGNFVSGIAQQWAFDTTRLRPILQQELAKRNIEVPFRFYYADKDSLLDQSQLPAELTGRHQVASRSFTTFRMESGQNFVRAVFTITPTFILGRLIWMLAGAVLLLIAIGYAFYYLLYLLRKEKKLSQIKNDFISNITHELKTPVATVSGAIESLTHFDGLADAERTKRYLGIARQELDRLSSLIQEVMQTSLYDQAGLQLKWEQVNLGQMVQEVVAAQQLANSASLQVELSLPDQPVWVMADKLHLYNALNNVLDNAVKYGGRQVRLLLEQTGTWVSLRITDNGHGIPEKYLPHIFEKFFRVPQGNRHTVKGYGLGLYYVKQVMEAHNGQCAVNSNRQQGTTFILNLPA